MKVSIYISCIFLLLFFSSCNNGKLNRSKKTQNVIPDTQISTTLTYLDSDSIYDTYFKSVSTYDGDKLVWEIKIFEKGVLIQTIKDSSQSMSYLVKAVDLNGDSIGELVFVTSYFIDAFNNSRLLKCNIMVYARENNIWIKLSVPAMTEKQKNGYFGNDVVFIENNEIIRNYPVYNENHNKSGDVRILKYKMDSINNIILTEDIVLETIN